MKINPILREWLEALVILLTMFVVIALPHPADAVSESAPVYSVASKTERSAIALGPSVRNRE